MAKSSCTKLQKKTLSKLQSLVSKGEMSKPEALNVLNQLEPEIGACKGSPVERDALRVSIKALKSKLR
ncbi:MAG: hypothetical protein ACREH5_03185 [Candidatus Omnitrophota bacterium]